MLDVNEDNIEEKRCIVDSIMKLCDRLPLLTDYIIKKVVTLISTFIANSSVLFMGNTWKKVKKSSENASPISRPVQLFYLSLIEKLSMSTENSNINTWEGLDTLIFTLLTINEHELSQMGSKILQWRIPNLSTEERSHQNVDFWNIIFELQNSSSSFHQTFGFICWLRWLSNSSDLKQDEYFQQVIKKPEYWKYLQKGLVTKTRDVSKYCASIIQLSVKGISTTFENEFISWDMSKEELFLTEWRRYLTLVEIIAIDTSINQAEAASVDLYRLLSPESLLKPSWGRSLLSSGIIGPMESVRRFTLNLALSLPKSSLALFKDGSDFLVDVLVPFAMGAPNFNDIVTLEKNSELKGSNLVCRYGERFSEFISNILKSLEEENAANLTGKLFKLLLKERYSFDPARIYLLRGILRGIDEKKILNKDHIDNLKQLFSTTAETTLRQKIIHTLHFEVILLLNPKEGLEVFLLAITKFVHFRGFDIFSSHMQDIMTYFKQSFSKKDIETLISTDDFSWIEDHEYVAVLSEILCSQDMEDEVINLLNTSKHLGRSLSYFIQSGCDYLEEIVVTYFQEEFVSFHLNLFSYENIEDLDIKLSGNGLEILIKDDILRDAFITNSCGGYITSSYIKLILNSISATAGSKMENEIVNSSLKLRYLSLLVKLGNIFGIGIPDLISLKSIVQLHTVGFKETPKKASRNFYMVKSDILCSIYRLLTAFLQPVDSKFIITDLISRFENDIPATEYDSRIQLCHCVKLIIDNHKLNGNELKSIVNLLNTLWKAMLDDRLIAAERDLHILFINLIFSDNLLKESFRDEEIEKILESIAMDIVKQCFARRSLLPSLAKRFYEYTQTPNTLFYQVLWIAKVLIRIFTFSQINDHLFTLEGIFDNFGLPGCDNLYEKVHGDEEISARVYSIATFAYDNSSISKKVKEIFASEVSQYILTTDEDYHLFKPIKRSDGFEEKTRVQCYTILVLLEKYTLLPEMLQTYYIPALQTEQSPLVRVYIEWIIARGLLTNSRLRDSIFKSTKLIKEQPRVIQSIERIGFIMAQQLTKDEESRFLETYLRTLITLCTSNRASIRHFSLSLVCALTPDLEKKGLKIGNGQINHILENIHKLTQSSEAFSQFRSGSSSVWNIESDLTLVGICGGVLRRISDRIDFIDVIDASVFQRYIKFDEREKMIISLGIDDETVWNSKQESIKDKTLSIQPNIDTISPLQTKSGAWSSVMDMYDSPDRGKNVIRSELIVIASLVDKPPNLGGICRVCDVLGAKLLCLNDISVAKHPQFKNVAVTAEQWMPMEQVPIDNIISFMHQKKKEGYTLIGLEQTDKSIQLNNEVKFPSKSLILIGREREGIDGDLLAELDICIEIKQVGVVRSMNIQTATAVIVHAYSSQHC